MRVTWIDILRGIGVILVILGHAPIKTNVFHYIYNFHMPLFFFISGYLFFYNEENNFFVFCYKKIKALLKAYLFLWLFSLAIGVIYTFIFNGSFTFDVKYSLKQFILAKRNNIDCNGALWFLPCLFITEILFFLLKTVLKRDVIILIITCILCYIGLVNFETMASVRTLIFTFDSSMWLILFYNLGFLLNYYKSFECEKKKNRYMAIIMGIPSFLLLFNMNLYYDIVDMLDFGVLKLPKFIFVVMMQISGISFYYGVAIKIKRNLILEYIGKRSVFVFGLHLPIIWPLMDKILPKLNGVFYKKSLLKLTIYILSSLVVTLILEKIYMALKMRCYKYLKSKENNIRGEEC